MEIQTMETALQSAVDSIRKTPAVRRRKNVSYAIVAKVGHEEIQKLREDGYSYNIICQIFSENGILDVGANPKNLCTAFLRETKRRCKVSQKKEGELKNLLKDADNAETKTTARATASVNKSLTTQVGKTEGGKSNAQISDNEKERIKQQSATVEKTAVGTLIKKYPDGGFDFEKK